MIVMQAESAREHRAHIGDAAVAPVLRRRLAKGLEIADAVLAESVSGRQRLVRDFEEQVLAGNDVAVLPVMAILTPTAAECDPASKRFSPRTLYALSRFTRFVNMLGFPPSPCPPASTIADAHWRADRGTQRLRFAALACPACAVEDRLARPHPDPHRPSRARITAPS